MTDQERIELLEQRMLMLEAELTAEIAEREIKERVVGGPGLIDALRRAGIPLQPFWPQTYSSNGTNAIQ